MSLLGMRPGWGGSTEVALRREDPKGGRGNCLRMLISWDGLVGSGSPGFDPAQLDQPLIPVCQGRVRAR